MTFGDFFGTREVGNGTCHLNDFVIGACGESHLIRRLVQHLFHVLSQKNELRNLARAHFAIGGDVACRPLEPFALYRPGARNTFSDMSA